MSEKIVSPGVFTRETDLSFITQGVGEIGGAFIGPFKQGPAFIPTIVNTQSEFEDIFGRPDGEFYTEFAVRNYLREAGTVTIVRVAGIGGYEQVSPLGVFTSGSEGRQLLTTFHSTEAGDETTGFTDTQFSHTQNTTRFEVSGSDIGVDLEISILPSDKDDVGSVFGRSAVGLKPVYVYSYFESSAELSEDSLETGDEILELDTLPVQDFSYDAAPANTPWIKSQLISGERYDLFRFYTRGDGNVTNRQFKIGISNVKEAGTVPGSDFGSFTVTLREFSDTDKRKTVIETFTNLSLDPASPNYIARTIGDKFITIDGNGKITENGTFQNNSRYIYVSVKEDGTFPISAIPFGHSPYVNPIKLNDDTEVPVAVFQTGSLSNTATNAQTFSGIDLEGDGRLDNRNYFNPLPLNATVGANEDFGLEDLGLSSQLTNAERLDPQLGLSTINKRQFLVGFQGGFDGKSPAISNLKGDKILPGNTQGFDLSSGTSSGTVGYFKAIAAISNADEFDINLVAAPGVIRSLHPAVFDRFVDLVDDRQDCFFVGDVVGSDATTTQAVQEASAVDSSYVGTYYPWVRTIDPNTNRQLDVPPSVLLPAIYAANDRVAAEWFAPAGLNRGGIVGAIGVKNRLTFSERDTLYEGKVNPIASFPGEGIVAYGQKTLQTRPSALDRINVRRLLIRVKKFVASTSRFLVFEQNTPQTRNQFINTVTPFLESIQQRQGLFAFRVVMDETNNTPDVIDRNILKGSIFLQPTRTAEFIVIDFNVLPTGATFSD